MKKLLWKELMEMRWMPPAYLALAVAGTLTWYISEVASYGPEQSIRRVAEMLYPGLLVLFCSFIGASGLLPASSVIANEVGHGTLTFLGTLPTTRQRYWVGKLLASGTIAAVSAFSILVVFELISRVLFSRDLLGGHEKVLGEEIWRVAVPSCLGIAFQSFCLSLLVSSLVDRPITAIMLSLVLEALLVMAGLNIFTGLRDFPLLMLRASAAYGFLSLLCLVSSYLAFCRGESLRTGKKYVITACVMAIGGLCFWVGVTVCEALS